MSYVNPWRMLDNHWSPCLPSSSWGHDCYRCLVPCYAQQDPQRILGRWRKTSQHEHQTCSNNVKHGQTSTCVTSISWVSKLQALPRTPYFATFPHLFVTWVAAKEQSFAVRLIQLWVQVSKHTTVQVEKMHHLILLIESRQQAFILRRIDSNLKVKISSFRIIPEFVAVAVDCQDFDIFWLCCFSLSKPRQGMTPFPSPGEPCKLPYAKIKRRWCAFGCLRLGISWMGKTNNRRMESHGHIWMSLEKSVHLRSQPPSINFLAIVFGHLGHMAFVASGCWIGM